MVLALCSCGGGSGNAGGGVAREPVAAPANAPRTDLLFGYFGIDGDQQARTSDHVNVVWLGSWNSIPALQEAKERGIQHAIVDLSAIVFTPKPYRYIPARPALRAYFAQLQLLGLLPMLTAVTPIDEPDQNLTDPADLATAAADIRAVLSEFDSRPALLANFYQRFFAVELFDWLACDSYHGPCDAPLLPGQRLLLLAGGADPWRESPDAYLARAQTDPAVVAVIAFAWFDNFREFGRGIGTNGMQPAYRTAGCTLTRKC